jgi:hypothetical protein
MHKTKQVLTFRNTLPVIVTLGLQMATKKVLSNAEAAPAILNRLLRNHKKKTFQAFMKNHHRFKNWSWAVSIDNKVSRWSLRRLK